MTGVAMVSRWLRAATVAAAVALALLAAAPEALAQRRGGGGGGGGGEGGPVTRIESRPGVRLPVFWQAASSPRGTALHFPGGLGGFGGVENGRPASRQVIIRFYHHFVEGGFNVAILGNPSDINPAIGLNGQRGLRTNDEHLADIRAAIALVRTRSQAPLWLVGYSAGTVSATHAAIHLEGERIAGLVLVAPIANAAGPFGYYHAMVPNQPLDRVRLPVLVLHHARDACPYSPASGAPRVIAGLSAAPVKKLILLDGGSDPSGDPCGPVHWHGFPNMEPQAIATILGWMARPVP